MSEIMSDKIVNHLISKYILYPLIEPRLIEQNVATRKNKGTKEGLRYVKKYINKLKINNDKIYVLKCDIKKYFFNIDHKIILNMIRKLIEDDDIYNLLVNIVNSTNEEYVNKEILKIVNHEIERINSLNICDKKYKINELKNISLYKKGKGLPIGNMTSQMLAVYYLNGLDHYLKEQIHCKYYIRYMDDFIIFDSDKNRLKEIRMQVEEKLKEYKLELNSKTNVYDLKNGFNFLGYRFVLKGKKLIIKINTKTKKRLKKKMNALEKKNVSNIEAVKASYKGYFSFANSKELLRKMNM